MGWKVKGREDAVRIGELASRTGVDPRLLRYYERQGLLHPAREANGYRDFDEADVAAVLWIRRLLGAGLSTATIAEFQACVRYQGPRRPRPASGCSTGSPRSGPGSTPPSPAWPPPGTPWTRSSAAAGACRRPADPPLAASPIEPSIPGPRDGLGVGRERPIPGK